MELSTAGYKILTYTFSGSVVLHRLNEFNEYPVKVGEESDLANILEKLSRAVHSATVINVSSNDLSPIPFSLTNNDELENQIGTPIIILLVKPFEREWFSYGRGDCLYVSNMQVLLHDNGTRIACLTAPSRLLYSNCSSPRTAFTRKKPRPMYPVELVDLLQSFMLTLCNSQSYEDARYCLFLREILRMLYPADAAEGHAAASKYEESLRKRLNKASNDVFKSFIKSKHSTNILNHASEHNDNLTVLPNSTAVVESFSSYYSDFEDDRQAVHLSHGSVSSLDGYSEDRPPSLPFPAAGEAVEVKPLTEENLKLHDFLMIVKEGNFDTENANKLP